MKQIFRGYKAIQISNTYTSLNLLFNITSVITCYLRATLDLRGNISGDAAVRIITKKAIFPVDREIPSSGIHGISQRERAFSRIPWHQLRDHRVNKNN